MQWYVNAMKNYAKFDGRATRQEYWMFYLFNLLFMFGILLMGGITDSDFFMILLILYYLAIIIPTISVTVRRLHDIGKSGAAIFYNLIPIAGPIIHLVQTCTESQQGDNQYGPNPKSLISNSSQPQFAATIETIFCGDCGQKTPVGNFCMKCGKELHT
ncbi:DUF805 domain-containing protein [Neobacillus drentensis]|uniref:DUF805 domain-containing protein n=1 Tax=Neobacillus drentensis TaxID=220684 RepID=UPI00082480FA|nr:DUF805 domain-containing protein [Neobacillus drentensis]